MFMDKQVNIWVTIIEIFLVEPLRYFMSFINAAYLQHPVCLKSCHRFGSKSKYGPTLTN